MANWQCREKLSKQAGRPLSDAEAERMLLGFNKSAVCPETSEAVPRAEYMRRERKAQRRMTALDYDD